MKNVLLINPPHLFYNQFQKVHTTTFYPLGLLSVATYVKNICHVSVLDFYMIDFQVTEMNGTFQVGTPVQRIRELIKEKKPDIVGISVLFTTQSESAIFIGQICREIYPSVTVVFGGADPSVRYNHYLENQICDYVVLGEGEKPFRELILNSDSKEEIEKIKGLAYLDEGKVRLLPGEPIQDLDEIPIPDYDLIPIKDYQKNKYFYQNRSLLRANSISLITSRGCPYDCIFCSIKLHMGQKYRYHSPEYVIRQIKKCRNELGIRRFHFEDDNISLKRDRFEAILDLLIKERLNIEWDTPNGIRADTLDKNLLKKMKQSGCKQVCLAIESGSQRVLDEIIKKKTSLEYLIEIATYCKELGIRAFSFYVIGFPGETKEEMQSTVDLALHLFKKIELIPAMQIATPFYGTELYEICAREGYIETDPTVKEMAASAQIIGNSLISTREFSKDFVRNLMLTYNSRLNWAVVQYLMKHPLYVFQYIDVIQSLIELVFLKIRRNKPLRKSETTNTMPELAGVGKG